MLKLKAQWGIYLSPIFLSVIFNSLILLSPLLEKLSSSPWFSLDMLGWLFQEFSAAKVLWECWELQSQNIFKEVQLMDSCLKRINFPTWWWRTWGPFPERSSVLQYISLVTYKWSLSHGAWTLPQSLPLFQLQMFKGDLAKTLIL